METKTLKQLIFGVLSAAVSFFLWKQLSQLLQHGGYAHAVPWILFTLALAAAEGLLFLSALGRNAWIVSAIAFANAALLLTVFGHGTPMLIAAAAFFLAGGLVFRFAHAIESSATGAYHHAAYRLAWPFALVLTGFAAYLSTGILTPTRIASAVTDYGYPYIAANIAPFNSEQTVDAYLTAQYKSAGVAKSTAEMLAQGRQEIGEQVGVTVSGDEKLSDVGKGLVGAKVQVALAASGFASGSWYYLFILFLVLTPLVRLAIAAGSDALIILGETSGFVKSGERQITVRTLDL